MLINIQVAGGVAYLPIQISLGEQRIEERAPLPPGLVKQLPDGEHFWELPDVLFHGMRVKIAAEQGSLHLHWPNGLHADPHVELKNDCHDPENGQFCSDGGGSDSGSGSTSSGDRPVDDRPTSKLPVLHEKTVTAISHTTATGLQHQQHQLDKVTTYLAGKGQQVSSTEAAAKLKAAFDRAEVTINFHPGRKLPNGKTMAQSMAESGHIQSVFEANASGVSQNLNLAQYKADRDKWESAKLSPEASNLSPDQRPKYAAVNWSRTPGALAHLYGGGVFVLNKEALLDRMSLAPGNTSRTKPEETASAREPVNALARNGLALQAAGLAKGADRVPGSRPQDYTEVHVWGQLPINKDTIQEIRLPKQGFFSRLLGNKHAPIEEFAKKAGIPVSYY